MQQSMNDEPTTSLFSRANKFLLHTFIHSFTAHHHAAHYALLVIATSSTSEQLGWSRSRVQGPSWCT
jgi:hypothetical protein